MDQWPGKNLCSVCETPLFVGHVLRLHGSNSSSNTKRAEPKCLPVDRAVQGRLTHEISLVVGTWGLIGELALHHRSPWYREFRNPEILAKKVRPVTKGLRNPDCKPLHWWHSSAFSSVIAHLKWRQQTTIKSEDPLFTMLNEIWHCFITSGNIHASCSDRRSTGSYTHRLSCHDCLRLRAIIIKILQKNWPLLSSSVIWLHLNPQFQGRLRCRVARNLRMTEVTQLFGIFGARSPGKIASDHPLTGSHPGLRDPFMQIFWKKINRKIIFLRWLTTKIPSKNYSKWHWYHRMIESQKTRSHWAKEPNKAPGHVNLRQNNLETKLTNIHWPAEWWWLWALHFQLSSAAKRLEF